MIKFLSRILLTLPFLCACQENSVEGIIVDDHGLILESINAKIEGEISATRSSSDLTPMYYYVGRKKFVEKDLLVIKRMERTSHPLSSYSYRNIRYQHTGTAMDRQKDVTGYCSDKDIYWSDKDSPHLFVGYATPNAWLNNDGTFNYVVAGTPRWQEPSTSENETITQVYTGQFAITETVIDNNTTRRYVDFNETENEIEVNPGEDISTAKTYKYSPKLRSEDLLLLYNPNQKADAGGVTATLEFRHALASLQVIFDIQDFAQTADLLDPKAKIYNLYIKDQPYKYRWTQTPGTNPETPGWGVLNDMNASDNGIDILAWEPNPEGEGSGRSKRIMFYSLIVPGQRSDFTMEYTVEYPPALHPDATENWEKHTYEAKISSIAFESGKCTTVKIHLNHVGEPIHIGAEFIDWEYIDTPDEGDLQKETIFLETSESGKITIANDSIATKDDATWLYKDGDDIKDIYGNVGSSSSPFTIKSAPQLLSFAYEVKKGRSFENQYVKLEADIFLQKSLTANDIEWPGIGDESHAFNGTFIGGKRIIKLLRGNPFFMNIGPKGHIENLELEDVIGPITGGGCLTNYNSGVLCGCEVLAKSNTTISLGNYQYTYNSTADTYAGFICAVNSGIIIANNANGNFTSTAHQTAGISGFNDGALVTNVAAGSISSSATTPLYGGINCHDVTPESETVWVKISDGTTVTNQPSEAEQSNYRETKRYSIFHCLFDETINTNQRTNAELYPQVIGKTTTELQKANIVGDKRPNEYLKDIFEKNGIPRDTNPTTWISTASQETLNKIISDINALHAKKNCLNTAILAWSISDWPKVIKDHFDTTTIQKMRWGFVSERYFTAHTAQYPRVH